ncbi:MFS transporter [Amycolatopsis sacchari]|uniref:Drug resistance transporter, EmrB/QacA subfamily n=1 Tax=Amycolatopsis sacchari TaxID=115433 RepID=A0A1I3K2K7_9PSEU|nr:MFS transporter [Amycolatopsis sacchari]SFI66654.1 drug resistance transporter, EmrB/QacA subfamily [Amycolatopsis sacchari]
MSRESARGRAVPDARARLVLRSGLGVLTLLLLCAVQFLDLVDASIVNVALPSIQRSLSFSQQNLQWVASGYVLTYGGFLLLGGRLGDLLGRRRMLLAGLMVFGVSSLAAGVATDAGLLVGSRLVQGFGAALMAPAALSELTTGFREGKDRNTALGVWGAISGIAAAVGLFLGGVLSQGPGWRWIFFVNPPICAVVAGTALVLLARDRRGGAGRALDWQGAVLVTGSMLLLVYSLVRAPDAGWGSVQTIATLAGSAVLMAAFAANERRSRHPLVPFAILRVKGLVAADGTQLIAFAGFFSLLFYGTLYMQEVLHYSPLQAGAAYLPITGGFIVAGGIASQLVTRVGTRPLVVAGCLIAAAGIYYVSGVPLHGSYVRDLLPGFMVMSLGAGTVFVSITAAANAGVPADKAGLAAGLLNSSQQVGSALGLAILSAVAIADTNHLLAAQVPSVAAADAGYHRALLVGSILMAAAALLALRTGNTRQAPPLVMVNTDPAAGPRPTAVPRQDL